MHLSKRWIAGATAIGMIAVSGVALVTPVAADSAWVDAGTLKLTTVANSAAGSVSYEPGAGGSFTTAAGQPLASANSGPAKCDLAPPPAGAALLLFRGAAGTSVRNAGLLNGSIGVNERLKELCWKVDTLSTTGDETLELELGPDLTGFAGRLMATRASLDLELRSTGFPFYSKARLTIRAFDGATAVGSPVQVAQGTGACNVSDDGNCQVVVEPGGRFNRLTLQVTRGSFSLEGGSDSGAQPTTFQLTALVDGTLDCETGATLSKDNASVTYVGYADDTDCAGFGATLTATNEDVRFLKPSDIDPTAQFVFGIAWLRPATAPTAIEATEVDWETGGAPVPLGWCPEPQFAGTVEIDGQTLPKLVGILDPGSVSDQDPTTPDTQYACLGSQYVTPQAGQLHIVEQIYVIGDIRLQK